MFKLLFDCCERGRPRFLLIPLFLTLCLVFYVYLSLRPPYALYTTLVQSEQETSLKWAQDIENNKGPSKYVKFRQLQGAGFNNQVQEILLFHHLALTTSRTYVYQPFVWRPRNALLPLSAFLPGVTNGSISSAVFDQVCPPSQVVHIEIGQQPAHVWEAAKTALNGPEKCVSVDDWIFHWTFLSSPALHPIWPSFRNYLSEHFSWSDHILNMVSRAYSELGLRSDSGAKGEPYIALHLRRGDFEQHCHGLARDHVGLTTWATLPMLHDSIFPPALDSSNETSTEEHCYSPLRRILDVIDMHARARPHLRALHVLHDGAWDHPLVYLQFHKLEAAVKSPERTEKAGWQGGPMTTVTHSGQLSVHWGENDFQVAVDVELARRAEVFIGNGYSSLSSQIAALRLATGVGSAKDITFL